MYINNNNNNVLYIHRRRCEILATFRQSDMTWVRLYGMEKKRESEIHVEKDSHAFQRLFSDFSETLSRTSCIRMMINHQTLTPLQNGHRYPIIAFRFDRLYVFLSYSVSIAPLGQGNQK